MPSPPNPNKKAKINNTSAAPLIRPVRPQMPVQQNNLLVAQPQMMPTMMPGMRPMTRPQGHASDVQHKIAMAKEQRRKALEEQERQNKTQADKAARDMEIERTKGGLNVAYHPALMMDTQKALMHVKDQMYHNRQQPGTSLESLLSKQEKKAEVVEKVNPYLDPMDRIRTAETPKPRISRTLKFAEPGKFINIASNLRAQENLAKLKREIEQSVKVAGLEKELDLVADKGLRTQEPPKVEWWDEKLVNGSYEIFNIAAYNPIVEELVTHLVQHPIPIMPPTHNEKIAARPVMLTKKEQKKMRRQNRLEVQRDKQDRIRLGLLPPDMPRVTKSNFMRILGQEAVLAPSMIESLVEKQVEARKQAHQDKLDSQKLTDEQRKEKKRLKLKEDTALLCNVAVFKIRQLTHAQHKFKVNQNAQQYNLTGVGIVYHDMSVVIVEGGPKGINAYKKLMLKRIDWAISNKDVFADVNECLLVWEGQVQTRNFYQFRLKTFPTEAQIKEYLEKMNSVHYWNTAKNYVVESI